MTEQWRPVPGYPFYEASSEGRVRSVARMVRHAKGGMALKKGKVLSPGFNPKNGYWSVSLYDEGSQKTVYVHHAVGKAFLNPVEGSEYLNHVDLDKGNNWAKNLEWMTFQENVTHGKEGGRLHASTNPNKAKKLTLETAREIRRLRVEEGLTYRELGKLFGVDPQMPMLICNGKSWVEPEVKAE